MGGIANPITNSRIFDLLHLFDCCMFSSTCAANWAPWHVIDGSGRIVVCFILAVFWPMHDCYGVRRFSSVARRRQTDKFASSITEFKGFDQI